MKQRCRGKWVYMNDRGWVRVRDRREVIAFALVERGGGARVMPIGGTDSVELRDALQKHADKKSKLMTDQFPAYPIAARGFASHETVNHRAEEWVRGEAGTQNVENFFSVFKRGMRGVYQHCSEEHLARYLHEFAFRYSNRAALGIDDAERTTRAIRGAEGKRLTYGPTR